MKTSSLLVAPVVRMIAILSLLGVIAAPLSQAQVSFFTPPTYAGSGPIFVADFNRDGKPDILASDGTLNLGNGDGTFTTGTSVTGTPLAVADFNGDGKPDVLEQGAPEPCWCCWEMGTAHFNRPSSQIAVPFCSQS
jgi:hypothetical protein